MSHKPNHILNKNVKINLELDAETTIPPYELRILCFNNTLQSFNDKQSECGQFTDRPKGIRLQLCWSFNTSSTLYHSDLPKVSKKMWYFVKVNAVEWLPIYLKYNQL